MFDIGWSEMLVIAVVMIVVVGPKDLPKMLRTFGKMASKVRGMAGDFQRQFNEALKEAELDDVKKSIDELRGLNPAAQLRKHVDPFQQAAADVRKGIDAAMKPKVAEPPTPASADVHTAEPLKTGPVGGPAVASDFVATTDTGQMANPLPENPDMHRNGATVEIVSPDAPSILPPLNAVPVEIVSSDAPKPKRSSRISANEITAAAAKRRTASSAETQHGVSPAIAGTVEIVSPDAPKAKAALKRRVSTAPINTGAREAGSVKPGRKKPDSAA